MKSIKESNQVITKIQYPILNFLIEKATRLLNQLYPEIDAKADREIKQFLDEISVKFIQLQKQFQEKPNTASQRELERFIEELEKVQAEQNTVIAQLPIIPIAHQSTIGARNILGQGASLTMGDTHISIFYPITTKNTSDQTIQEQEFQLFNIPPKNSYFTGRKKLLKKLEQHFENLLDTSNLKPVVLTACHGLGGVGKTELAKEFIYRYLDRYSMIAWVPSENDEQLSRTYLELARTLKLVSEQEKIKDIKEVIRRVKYWLENHPGYLLIFDNASNYSCIRDYLPNTGGHVLVTSRYTEWLDRTIPVDVFTIKESRNYMQTILCQDKQREDKQQAIDKLVETLGCLPLALAQASAYIRKNRISIERYLIAYAERKEQLLNDMNLPVGTEHMPIFVTWDITMEIIQDESPFAAKLLQLCSYLYPEGILQSWFNNCSQQNVINPKREVLETAWGILASYSLITVNIQAETISLHVLIKEVLQLKRRPEEKMKEVKLLYAIFRDNYPRGIKTIEDYKKMRHWLPHLEALTIIANRFSKQNTKQEKEIKLEKTETDWEKQGLAIQERFYGEDPIDIAKTLINLSTAYGNLGAHQKKIAFLKRALDTQERYYGNDHVEIVNTLNDLGLVCEDSGDYQQMREYLERALAIKAKNYGQEHPETAMALNNLAGAYLGLNFLELAYKTALRAYQILLYHSDYGLQHSETQKTKNLLDGMQAVAVIRGWEADSYLEFARNYHYIQNNLFAAIRNYKKVIELIGENEKALPAHHDLACLYHVMDQCELAEYHFQKALDLNKRASTYCDYGLLLINQERFRQAINIFLLAINLNDKSDLVYGKLEKKILDPYLQQEIEFYGTFTIQPALMACYCLIHCYRQLKEIRESDEMLASLKQSIQQTPKAFHRRLLNYVYQMIEKQTQQDNAVAHLKEEDTNNSSTSNSMETRDKVSTRTLIYQKASQASLSRNDSGKLSNTNNTTDTNLNNLEHKQITYQKI